MITREQFLKDVMAEIEGIKETATNEEKKRLDIDFLDPMRTDRCIYGLLTGDCMEARAREIMDVSCKRVWNLAGDGVYQNRYRFLDSVLENVNGDYESRRTWDNGKDARLTYLSALEGYIALNDAKNEEIIAYIKGDTDTLEL